MNYWICEILVYKSLRIHAAACRFSPASPKSTRSTQWHGPFDTRKAAIDAARRLGHPESRGCPQCLPEVGLLWELVIPGDAEAPGS